MKTCLLFVIPVVILLGTVDPAAAQATNSAAEDSDRAAAAEKNETLALALLSHYDGVWDARWDWLGEDGEIIGKMVGVEEYELSPGGYVLKALNTVPEFDVVNYGLISYSPISLEILFYSVDNKGDVWIMRQDPATEVMISEPHLEADGRQLILRFTRLEKSAHEMTIKMERSYDAGQTWTTGFIQYMTRRT